MPDKPKLETTKLIHCYEPRFKIAVIEAARENSLPGMPKDTFDVWVGYLGMFSPEDMMLIAKASIVTDFYMKDMPSDLIAVKNGMTWTSAIDFMVKDAPERATDLLDMLNNAILEANARRDAEHKITISEDV